MGMPMGVFHYSSSIGVKGALSHRELKEENLADLSREELDEYLHKLADDIYAQREADISPEIMRELENLVMLKVVDNHWMEHLDAMDMLREGVGLRAYGYV